MELEFETLQESCLRLVLRETRSQEETSEIIVPDSCPDAGRIVYTAASAVLRSRECRAGSVTLTGGVRACVVYVPEDGGAPRALETYLPFVMRAEAPGASEDTILLAEVYVRAADARIINSRKVLVRADVGCALEGYEKSAAALRRLRGAPETLQLKTQTYTLTEPVQEAEKAFVISEELELPAASIAADRICCWEASPRITEEKTVGSKAVFKGTLFFRMLYLTQENTFGTWEQQLPFSQFCELEDDAGDGEAQTSVLVTNAELEPDGGDGRRFLLTVSVLAQCVVSEARQVELCEDAYATEGSFEPEWQAYEPDCRLDSQTLRAALQGMLPGAVRAVVAAGFYPDCPDVQRTDAGVRVTVPVNVNLLYLDEQGQPQGLQGKAEAVCETALSPDGVCRVSAALSPDSFVSPGAGGAEVHGGAAVRVSAYAGQKLRNLSGGTLGEEKRDRKDRPSVVVLLSRERQPLWDLARKYRTTEKAIRQANHLEGAETEPGELLLIPM